MLSIKSTATVVILTILLILIGLEVLLQIGALIASSTSRELPSDWATQKIRVMALGDSNTFGLYLEEEQSYPSQLESLWNSTHPDNQQIEVLNMSYPGTNSYRIAGNIDEMMTTFRPDIVLLTIGVNDAFTAYDYLQDSSSGSFATSKYNPLNLIRRYSRLYKIFYMSRQGLAQAEADKKKEETTQQPEDLTISVPNRELLTWDDDLDNRMERIREFKQANKNASGNESDVHETLEIGGNTIVMVSDEDATDTDGSTSGSFDKLQRNVGMVDKSVSDHGATLYILTYLSSDSYYGSANAKVAEYAKRNPEVNFIDISGKFKEFCKTRTDCADMFFQDMHPREEGYAKVAEFIAQRLETDKKLNRGL